MAKGFGAGKGQPVCLACLVLLVVVIIALLGLVGLCLNIWQIVDAMKTNGDLMSLARVAVEDDRLINAIKTSLAFLSLSVFFSCLARNNDDNDDSTRSICRAVLNLILLAGYLACGILAALYFNKTLPRMQTGMEEILKSSNYLSSTKSLSQPKYTDLGKHFNFLQTKYDCCGVAQPNGGDYIAADFPARYNLTVPYSCCVLKDKEIDRRNVNLDDVVDYEGCSAFDPQFFHTETCYQHEHKFLEFKCHFIMGYNFTMVSLVVVLFIAIFLVICCARN